MIALRANLTCNILINTLAIEIHVYILWNVALHNYCMQTKITVLGTGEMECEMTCHSIYEPKSIRGALGSKAETHFVQLYILSWMGASSTDHTVMVRRFVGMGSNFRHRSCYRPLEIPLRGTIPMRRLPLFERKIGFQRHGLRSCSWVGVCSYCH